MADQNGGIEWREWGADAFEEAKAQDKVVLLDIGAVWCHWCHVMDTGIPGDPDHTGTYSDPEVQRRIAERFIPIKVDNDKRPDINARYNMGGWPTTAFLTPDGETLYGETYVPPRRMLALLDHIAGLWRERKDEVIAQTAQMRAQRAAAEKTAPASELDPQTGARVAEAIMRHFDPEFGGFVSGNGAGQPKFPHPDALLFALEQYALTGDAALREAAIKTLHGMADGGMYDRFAGGFFRYSTTRDWSIPHFEKMLEDNAKLTAVYAVASQVLGDDAYLDMVRSAHGWLLSEMYDAEAGTFAGSQDADKEEAYYGKPLDLRAALPTPYIDRTVYAGWNALMVSSLAARYKITGEQEILDAARKTFRSLAAMGIADNSSGNAYFALIHYAAHGEAQGMAGLLSDQTSFLEAGLELYEATGEAGYRDAAKSAADYVLAALEDTEAGGFFDLSPEPDALGELSRPKKDMAENAAVALALIRLSCVTEDERYRQAAQRALKVFADDYAQMSYFASGYARAVEAAIRPALHLIIAGPQADTRRWELQQAAWSIPIPGKTVETLDPARAAERGYPAREDGAPRAYLCLGTRCLAPIETADGLQQALRKSAKSG
jgi:hypothetical protein